MGLLDGVLQDAVTDEGVRYDVVAAHRRELQGFIDGLARSPGYQDYDGDSAESIAEAARINGYNVAMLLIVIDAMPLASILSIDGGKVWDTHTLDVAGEHLTLNEVEGRLRATGDPRIHAALNCASKSCAPLSKWTYLAGKLDAQLDGAAWRWAGTTAFHVDGSTVALSQVFHWYAADFPAGEAVPHADAEQSAALRWLTKYTDPATASKLVSGELTASWAPYDWDLNSVPAR
jgi:hypothetical protein